jgi:hypothetical protein
MMTDDPEISTVSFGRADNSFYKIFCCIFWIFENNYLAAFRILKMIAQLIDDEIVVRFRMSGPLMRRLTIKGWAMKSLIGRTMIRAKIVNLIISPQKLSFFCEAI